MNRPPPTDGRDRREAGRERGAEEVRGRDLQGKAGGAEAEEEQDDEDEQRHPSEGEPGQGGVEIGALEGARRAVHLQMRVHLRMRRRDIGQGIVDEAGEGVTDDRRQRFQKRDRHDAAERQGEGEERRVEKLSGHDGRHPPASVSFSASLLSQIP